MKINTIKNLLPYIPIAKARGFTATGGKHDKPDTKIAD
jgi:hypothetical protein